MKLSMNELEMLEKVLTELNLDSEDGYCYIQESLATKSLIFLLLQKIHSYKQDEHISLIRSCHGKYAQEGDIIKDYIYKIDGMNKNKVFTIIGYEYKELLNDGQFFIVYKMKNNLDNEIRLYLESDLDRLFEVKND